MEDVLAVAEAYCAATAIVEIAGNKFVKADDHLYYKCPHCKDIVWVHKAVSDLSGAVCFRCQRDFIGNAIKGAVANAEKAINNGVREVKKAFRL